jgi:Ca2+-binding RTX toxin-like protein
MTRVSGSRKDDAISPTRFVRDGEEDTDRTRPGNGNDQVYGGRGNDTVDGGRGFDSVYGGEDDDQLRSYSRGDSLYGGEGRDELRSYNGQDSLYGGEGDDWLRRMDTTNHPISFNGGDGHDLFDIGQSDNDSVYGGTGNDTLVADTVMASLIDGGAGEDILNLASGGIDLAADTGLGVNSGARFKNFEGAVIRQGGGQLFGDSGANRLQVDGLRDGSLIDGRDGDDQLRGSDGADRLIGGKGSDTLFGRGGDDVLDAVDPTSVGREVVFGGTGDDSISASLGSGYYDGGEGIDRVAFDTTKAMKIVIDGTDAQAVLTGVEVLWAGSGNDTITGSARADRLHGRDGDDVLVAGAGEDRLYGGRGDDRLSGSLGDSLYGGAGDDSVTGSFGLAAVDGGQGRDLIDLSLHAGGIIFDLGTGFTNLGGPRLIEFEDVRGGAAADTLTGGGDGNLLMGGAGRDDMTGRGGNDTLMGATGRDVLRGGYGDDVLDGGRGGDALTGGPGRDTFVFRPLMSGPTTGTADHITRFDGAGMDLGDRIDLSAIDADDIRLGDQAFVLGGALTLVEDGTDTVIVLNTDSDSEAEMMIVITDGALRADSYAQDDFIL